jgi:hypothetical protein
MGLAIMMTITMVMATDRQSASDQAAGDHARSGVRGSGRGCGWARSSAPTARLPPLGLGRTPVLCRRLGCDLELAARKSPVRRPLVIVLSAR